MPERELKKMVADITKVGRKSQTLHKDEHCMNDNNPLTEDTSTAAPQKPKHPPGCGCLFWTRVPAISTPLM